VVWTLWRPKRIGFPKLSHCGEMNGQKRVGQRVRVYCEASNNDENGIIRTKRVKIQCPLGKKIRVWC
jgi:hypothetical protein